MSVPARARQTIAILNKQTNCVEVSDLITGEIVKIQSNFIELPDSHFEVMEVDGKSILIERGLSLDFLPKPKIGFSWPLLDHICKRYVEGESLSKICEDPGMPSYNTLSRWRREIPDIGRALDESRTDRAEYFADRALEVAETADEDTIQVDKLKVDVNKWMAGVSNPENYGNRTKVVGDKNAPISFVIDTGIRKPEDYNKDETTFEKDVTPKDHLDGDTATTTEADRTGSDDSISGDGSET